MRVIRAVLLAVTLGLVAAPLPASGAASQPTVRPGPPERLIQPSPWVPLLAEDPIPAASAVYPATVATGPWNRSQVPGLVLLSADVRQYRRLPVPAGSALEPVLSPDGRRLALVDRTSRPGRDGPAGVGITVWQLDRGTSRTVRAAVAGGAATLRYALFGRDGGRLYLVLDGPGTDRRGSQLWTVDLTPAAPAARLVCRCDVRLGVDADGRVWVHDGTDDPQLAALGLPVYGQGRPLREEGPDDALGTVPDALVASGRLWAEAFRHDTVRVVGPGTGRPAVVRAPGTAVRPLLVQGSVVIVTSTQAGPGERTDRRPGEPPAGPSRVTLLDGRTGEGGDQVEVEALPGPPQPAFAHDLLVGPLPRPVAAGDVPRWSGDRREALVGAALASPREHPLPALAVAAALLTVGGLLVARRRGRRDRSEAGR